MLSKGVDRDPEEVRAELVASVREEIGPVASFKVVVVVERLPKTRSGKILRRTMRSMAEGDEYAVPSTIEDAAVLGEVEDAIHGAGFPTGNGQ